MGGEKLCGLVDELRAEAEPAGAKRRFGNRRELRPGRQAVKL
jgi:hypothetical protein